MKDRLAGLGLFLVHPTTRAKYTQMKALTEENQTDLCDRESLAFCTLKKE